jgi:cytoskeleton protein RodZ
MPFDLCIIGQLLRETREKKGLTFEEVSNALFVRKRVIGAIEAGDWDNLPHPVYVKGYVTQYATLLSILDLIESEVTSAGNELPVQRQEGVRKRKEGILKRWQFRKRRAQESQPLNAPWSVIDQLSGNS